MEEREALKREIELLQNLIDKHKSVHGDTPFTRVPQWPPEALTSARGHTMSVVHRQGSRGRLYAPQSHASWRKTFSLKNKNPQASAGHPSISASSCVHLSHSENMSPSTSVASYRRGQESVKTTTSSSGISPLKKEGHVNSVTQIREDAKKGTAVSKHEEGKVGSSSTLAQYEMLQTQIQKSQQRPESMGVVLPEKKSVDSSDVPSLVKVNTIASLQNKPSLISRTHTDTKLTITTTTSDVHTTGNTAPPLGALPRISKHPSGHLTSHSIHRQGSAPLSKKSKFIWVKSQNVGAVEPNQASCIPSSTVKAATASPTTFSKAGAASGSSHVFTVNKKTPAKKPLRKPSLVTAALKSSKYKWVSSSVGGQTKISRKSLSPKPLTSPQRALEKGEATKKVRAVSTPSAKIRKEVTDSWATSSLSNRYRWKAGGQSTVPAVTTGAIVSRRRSAFHWTSEKSNRGVRGGFGGPSFITHRTSLTLPSSSSPTVFKIRSRMKIIRKTANSGGGSERVTSPSALKYSPRGRTHGSIRIPAGVRRTPSRDLVSFGRHKLRRLSTFSSRTTLASSSSASHREFGSCYKTCLGSSAAYTHQYNPALSWRAKRIQFARSFLQSRLRAPHYRHLSSTQQWRGSSMCWIRGSLYRVSANKLSRTTASSMSINRTGKFFSTAQASAMTPVSSRTSSTRHLASRAVQRSLAIIRHARQKKQPKQYCMYYNRFGRCNRGNSCPYIHDPDKVAVCTRFLRGTCKQADGTCPFSHKVAKNKMPVCSYFLKGICNNSDCPYSHVYVSRKAEVCEDFVKGYCPEGEKCKKKHTLLCPDFSKTGSCPRGARCKLQHRQQAKRSAGNTTTTPAKRTRTKESSKRPQLSVVIAQGSQAAPGTPTKGPLELPSFISLSSSPEEADAPDILLTETSQVKEKKLQIKPRL